MRQPGLPRPPRPARCPPGIARFRGWALPCACLFTQPSPTAASSVSGRPRARLSAIRARHRQGSFCHRHGHSPLPWPALPCVLQRLAAAYQRPARVQPASLGNIILPSKKTCQRGCAGLGQDVYGCQRPRFRRGVGYGAASRAHRLSAPAWLPSPVPPPSRRILPGCTPGKAWADGLAPGTKPGKCL